MSVAFAQNLPKELDENIKMKAINNVPSFETLLPDENVKSSLKFKDVWKANVPNVNSVSSMIKIDGGYLLCGSTLSSETISLNFNKTAFAEVLNGSSSLRTPSDKEYFSISKGEILVSLLAYSNEGKLLFKSEFKNKMVSPSSLDGRILMSLTPLYIEQDSPFESFIFIYSKEGKLIAKKSFKNRIINSMIETENEDILCGTIKSEKKKEKYSSSMRTALEEYVLLLNTNLKKKKDIKLDSESSFRVAYDALTDVVETSDAYVFSGVAEFVKVEKDISSAKAYFIRPYLGKGEYFVDVLHEDANKNLLIFGYFGRKGNHLQKMRIQYLQSVSRPADITESLNPAARKLRNNPAMRMVYNEMLSDLREETSTDEDPFRAVYTHDGEFIMKRETISYEDVSYKGTSEKGGSTYVEILDMHAYNFNGVTKYRQYMYDNKAKTIMVDSSKQALCEYECLLTGTTHHLKMEG
jgi:hypothetical protein